MAEMIAGTYEIIEKIGSGGNGNVFLANHMRLGKKVVLKADKRKITARQDVFRREVDVLKELSHPNIPQVYDFFIDGKTVYTVMEYINGESLDKPLIRGERFSQPQVIKWAIQILEALCYLHSPIHGDPPKGFVHSDIKPANLMRKPNNDISLIDFNIALALGEENVVGFSVGYTSPEHYGLDYSVSGDSVVTDEPTEKIDDKTATVALSQINSSASSAATRKKRIMPDVRSDIYSVGATLYHLLSGKRPAKDATEVVPLSDKEFSPQIAAIIKKAMEPNPNLRFQTADEMLESFLRLRKNDPRARRLKRNEIISYAIASLTLVFGVTVSFLGLKGMQLTESRLKLAEYSQNALSDGDTAKAVQYALDALPQNGEFFGPQYIAKAQSALADALGVYDLSDGFKTHKTVEIPASPLFLSLSPDGKTAVCIYSGAAAVFDTESSEIISTLNTDRSALSEVEFIDNDIIVYSGANGICAYNIKTLSEIWKGKPATAIAVSGDKKTVIGIYKDEAYATLYNAENGVELGTVDFDGKHQQITANDIFANPNDNLLSLNEDGSLLGISFADGSLELMDLKDPENSVMIYDGASGYSHFEGGFYKRYFAFSASTANKSAFAVIDTNKQEQTGGFESDKAFSVCTDENGICLQTENLLVRIDPVTGEQAPLITTAENILSYAVSDRHTIAAYKNGYMFFDERAALTSKHESDYSSDFLQISNGIALIGSMDSPVIRIMKYENHPETEIFTYDPSYPHDEARISGDGKTVMLFSYKQFRVYSVDGELIKEVDIPNAQQIYDQQYIRDAGGSRLEVIYNDGTVIIYNARDGTKAGEEKRSAPDLSLDEEFLTDNFRIESPLHGVPKVYDLKSGDLVCELSEDAYLTYVTQAGEYLITQYVTADGYCYGLLLNGSCEAIATLPYLSDIVEQTLIFDYPTGNMRKTRIYNINELISLANQNYSGGTQNEND